ncbi:hypothetical protein [Arthrobacter sp. C152]
MHYEITSDRKVLGVPVLDAQELPGDDSAIVLLDYSKMGEGSQRNLVKVRNDGSIAWIAELPDTGNQECYLSMDLGPAGVVFANTWLCYRVSIDAGTGRVLGKEFTK